LHVATLRLDMAFVESALAIAKKLWYGVESREN
jgi:hypothetical protein